MDWVVIVYSQNEMCRLTIQNCSYILAVKLDFDLFWQFYHCNQLSYNNNYAMNPGPSCKVDLGLKTTSFFFFTFFFTKHIGLKCGTQTLHSQFVNSTFILPLLCIHTFKTLYSIFTTWELHIHTLQGYKLLELLNSITDSHMHNSTFMISILHIHNLKPPHSHISRQLYIHTIISLHSRFLYYTFTHST